MSEGEKTEHLPLDRAYPCDIRFFRERAREERRRIRHADCARARQVHAEMAEHYDMVAELLAAKAGTRPRSLAASLRHMLELLWPG